MGTGNNIYVFLQKNMTGCRVFWGLMYTMFFIFAWVSFYSTTTQKDTNTYLGMSIYVAIGFVLYWLLFLVMPLAYLIHHVTKEKVDGVKCGIGVGITSAIFKFLVSVTFPVFSICVRDVFEDVASTWTCICLVGSLQCLLMCYGNPHDYGISYGFLGLLLGVFVQLKSILQQSVVVFIFGVSYSISKEKAFLSK